MNSRSSGRGTRRFDKQLLEAGQQCLKRLYLDYHAPTEVAPSDTRLAMSEAGRQLLLVARSAFPRGTEIAAEPIDRAAAQTAELLAGETTAVLFGAAFVADGREVSTDIVVRQKTGELDIYEVKSGTKVKARYVTDLALQALTIERAGHKVRGMFVLHLDKTYKHAGGAEYPPAGLLKSADVTERVRRQMPRTSEEIERFLLQLQDDSVLQMPTGTFCTYPFPCPHLTDCARKEPEFSLRHLPDLARPLEDQLHEAGIDDLAQLDPARPGLTFRQRRTIQAVRQRELLIEPFVAEELAHIELPLHFLAMSSVTEALPRFEHQRPWQSVPYAWAALTVHADGRVEQAAFVHADKGDPRADFVRSLGKHLEAGGMILCWCSDLLASVRDLLESVPAEKPATRTVLARSHLDLRRLLESGLFHPGLTADRTLATIAATLLGGAGDGDLVVRDDEGVFGLLQKATAPRTRAATRAKIAADIQAWLDWQTRTMLAVYQKLSARPLPEPQKAPRAPLGDGPRKQLPPT
ncbi:MAG: DUF2779 domain-containing protein [Planctomycetota bacterium]